MFADGEHTSTINKGYSFCSKLSNAEAMLSSIYVIGELQWRAHLGGSIYKGVDAQVFDLRGAEMSFSATAGGPPQGGCVIDHHYQILLQCHFYPSIVVIVTFSGTPFYAHT